MRSEIARYKGFPWLLTVEETKKYTDGYGDALLKNLFLIANFGAEANGYGRVNLEAVHILFPLGKEMRRFRKSRVCEMLIDGMLQAYHWEFAEACAEALMRIGGRDGWHALADYNERRISGQRWDGVPNIHASFLNAARRGYILTLKFLIDEGVDMDVSDKDGKTALMLSCENPLTVLTAVSVLLENHADVNIQDTEGKTALMCAVLHKVPKEVIEMMLKYGANTQAKDSSGKGIFDMQYINEEIKDILLPV